MYRAWSVLVGLSLIVAVSAACRGATSPTDDAVGPADTGETAPPGAATPVATTGARGAAETPEAALTPVTLMLDWVPNTNHSGIYVAEGEGYFREVGLGVDIVQPGQVMAQQVVASGAADFGIDFQEQLTIARTNGVPVVSIAAIIQHNTSGFASRGELEADSPADWEGMTYASFASPFEEPTLNALMACDGGDPARLEMVNTGLADPLALLDADQVDLAWIFYGWQGIQAERQGIEVDVVMMSDWTDCVPDYYTPIVIASEDTVRERPELARAFVGALSRGYRAAIDDPALAVRHLMAAAPELDREMVEASQAWLSPRYQADAPRWGEQSLEVWSRYAAWMRSTDVIDRDVDAEAAFTNEFLPPASP